jgi:hypothetical protein
VKTFSTETDFLAAVLDWVKHKDPQADRITEVSAYGTDWAGSTDAGFYDDFEVTITYMRVDGSQVWWREIRGEDMASLWQAVIGDYKAE